MPSGVPINKVRIVAHTTNPVKLRNHATASAKPYKTPYYVTVAEGSNFRLGMFSLDGKLFAKPDNALRWAQNHKNPDYLPMDRQAGFIGYIFPGTMAIAAENGNVDSVKYLSAAELAKRLYKVVKFRSDRRITFMRHIEARPSVVLARDLSLAGKHKDGESQIDFKSPHELLLLSPSIYFKNMLLEGIHFKMHIDGTIEFLQ